MEEREFFESIRDEKNIVIYGAKKMAQELIKRMKYIGIIPKAVVVSDKSKDEIGIEGYTVKNLDELGNIPECTFIIAAGEKFKNEIESNLKTKGAKKIYALTWGLFLEIENIKYMLII